MWPSCSKLKRPHVRLYCSTAMERWLKLSTRFEVRNVWVRAIKPCLSFIKFSKSQCLHCCCSDPSAAEPALVAAVIKPLVSLLCFGVKRKLKITGLLLLCVPSQTQARVGPADRPSHNWMSTEQIMQASKDSVCDRVQCIFWRIVELFEGCFHQKQVYWKSEAAPCNNKQIKFQL